MASQGDQCLAHGGVPPRGQVGTPSKEGLKTHLPHGISRPLQPEVPLGEQRGERESRGTLCEPRSYCVTGAVPIDHRLAAELNHLVQPQLPAVDGGGLGLQGDDELFRVLRGGQARLEDREMETRTWDSWAGLLRGHHTLQCGWHSHGRN